MDIIKEVLGIELHMENWEKKHVLPLYILDLYNLQLAMFSGAKFLIADPNRELSTLPSLKKHIQKIQAIEDIPVVFYLKNISFYRRKNLIENQIPFVTNKQIYLPFIGTFLTDENEESMKTEKFTISAQQLLLLYLYSKKPELYVSEATQKLSYSPMTLSRAVKQLDLLSGIRVKKMGVHNIIEGNCTKQEIFEEAKPYLSSPVSQTGYLYADDLTEKMVLSGESALSEWTILNQGKMMTYAIYEKDFNKKSFSKELIDPGKQVKIELWKYPPTEFSFTNDVVDKLSLALSFSEHPDERVEGAVEELLQKTWEEIE
ncbi:MAG: MarR family transcriptional regulator [Peptostreptococcaceae bacterium]|nr:MarR family transcriptional regulator [Peptostreptococcaceae bacterium]